MLDFEICAMSAFEKYFGEIIIKIGSSNFANEI